MTYMRNVKKVTQVTYVQNVMMIIDLNIDLFYLLPFLRNSQAKPFFIHKYGPY